MQNIKIKKASKRFLVLCLLLVLGFLHCHLGREKTYEMQTKMLNEEIIRTLASALEKNPDLKSCKIIVNFDLEKDPKSSNWIISNVVAESGDGLPNGVDSTKPEALEDDDLSTGDDDRDHERKGDDAKGEGEYHIDNTGEGNILGWLLGGAFIVILLIAAISRMRPNIEKILAKPNKEGLHHGEHYHDNNQSNESQVCSNRQQHNCSDEKTKSKEGQQIVITTQAVLQKTADKPVQQEPFEETPKSVKVTPELVGGSPEPVTPVPVESIIKYGQIAVLSLDELITEEDYMSDEATGMPFEFCFSPNMEQGAYDISCNSRISFLRDISIIRPFVQNFDDVSNPKKIVTVSKGKLSRKGLSWVVTEKLKIKLT